jgi:hypothetical protein
VQVLDVHNCGIVLIQHKGAYDIGQGHPRQTR